MRIGYLECFAGISGDMMLGALVDAGVSLQLLEETARSLALGAELRLSRVDRSGISSAKVDVVVDGAPADSQHGAGQHSRPHSHGHEHSHSHAHEGEEAPNGHKHLHEHSHENGQSHSHVPGKHEHTHGRSLFEIRALIAGAGLGEEAKALALRTFALLAESESKIHNVSVEDIHFHEVGAVDAIIDIVCSVVGLCSLGVDRWVSSPLNVGGGFIDCAHGQFPVPAPATAELLRGAPTYSSGMAMEMVTPTGAALIRALGCSFGDAPAMTVSAIGYGAGTRDPRGFPNVLRISIGEASSMNTAAGRFPTETIAVLECAIDDMNPQVLANTAHLALELGALDVMCASVTMKKGRIGTLLTLLCRLEDAAKFQELLFRETSSLGIRFRPEQRVRLDRETIKVQTQYGAVRVKIASSRGDHFHAQPEYEDCRRFAAEAGVPLKEVMEAAMLAFADSHRTTEAQA